MDGYSKDDKIYNYFITVKEVTIPTAQMTYDIYNYWKTLAESKQMYIRHVYETGKSGRLHMHMLIRSKPGLYLKPFFRKGYLTDIRQVYDYEGLMKYLDKEIWNDYKTVKENYVFDKVGTKLDLSPKME